jgi:hypothetical protein
MPRSNISMIRAQAGLIVEIGEVPRVGLARVMATPGVARAVTDRGT